MLITNGQYSIKSLSLGYPYCPVASFERDMYFVNYINPMIGYGRDHLTPS